MNAINTGAKREIGKVLVTQLAQKQYNSGPSPEHNLMHSKQRWHK